MTKLEGYTSTSHSRLSFTNVFKYTWCYFSEIYENHKFNFKVTSAELRYAHNTRNMSMIEWVEPNPWAGGDSDENDSDAANTESANTEYTMYYGEVQFFFTVELPRSSHCRTTSYCLV